MSAEFIIWLSHVLYTTATALLCLFHADALRERLESKTILRTLGFGLIAFGSASYFYPSLFQSMPQVLTWILTVGYFMIFVSFLLDEYTKFTSILVLGIIVLPFLNEAMLFVVNIGVSIILLQHAYTTKHRDLIPLLLGFLCVTLAYFFELISQNPGFKDANNDNPFFFILAAIAFFYWMWTYFGLFFLKVRWGSSKETKTTKDTTDTK